MGIFGLTTFCNDHVDTASTLVQLRADTPTTILVDASGVLSRIAEQAQSGLTEHAKAYGGSYALYERAIERFVLAMIHAGITLRFFFDPSRGLKLYELRSPSQHDAVQLTARYTAIQYALQCTACYTAKHHVPVINL